MVHTIGLPEPLTRVIVEPGSDFPLIIVLLLSIKLIDGADGAVVSFAIADELAEDVPELEVVEDETAELELVVDDEVDEIATTDDELAVVDEIVELEVTFEEAVLEFTIAEEEVTEELLVVEDRVELELELIAELETADDDVTELETADELDAVGAEKLVGIVRLATPVGEITDKTPDDAPVVELAGIV